MSKFVSFSSFSLAFNQTNSNKNFHLHTQIITCRLGFDDLHEICGRWNWCTPNATKWQARRNEWNIWTIYTMRAFTSSFSPFRTDSLWQKMYSKSSPSILPCFCVTTDQHQSDLCSTVPQKELSASHLVCHKSCQRETSGSRGVCVCHSPFFERSAVETDTLVRHKLPFWSKESRASIDAKT